MVGGRNLFGIWDSIEEKIPFAARRTHWSKKDIYVIIDKMEPNGKGYGKAFGYVTQNGVPNEYFDYNKRWRETREIPNSGVGGWEIVEGVTLELIRTVEEE